MAEDEMIKRRHQCVSEEEPCLSVSAHWHRKHGILQLGGTFLFGHGSEEEHQQLRRERGSFNDHFESRTFDAHVGVWDIVATVYRIPHRKKFTIPLSELQAVDKESHNYQLLKDYTVWFVNGHY